MSEEEGIDWEDGGETLPSGWMKRPESVKMKLRESLTRRGSI